MRRLLFAAAIISLAIFSSYSAICIGVSRTILRYSNRVDHMMLASSLAPKDPKILKLLAEIRLFDPNRLDLPKAREIILDAIKQSPYDCRLWLVRAAAEERLGDPAAAENSLKRAAELAPNHFRPNWDLANLRLRNGDVQSAAETFRSVLTGSPDQIPYALDLFWQITEDAKVLESVIPDAPSARCQLIDFLIKKGESETAFRHLKSLISSGNIERQEVAERLLNKLIEEKNFDSAWEIWANLPKNIGAPKKRGVQNGDFQTPVSKQTTGFGWSYADYPKVKLLRDAGPGSSGYSIKILYEGSPEESLEHLKQTVLVEPNRKYVLRCKIRASNLTTVSAPKISVTELTRSGAGGSFSTSIRTGSYDWQSSELAFETGADARAVLLSLRRDAECNKGDPCPIFGSFWFSEVELKHK